MPIQINDVNVIDDGRNFYAAGIATVGSGSSATVIDGNTGIVNVGAGITMEGIPGNISIAGTINAAGFNVPVNVVSFNPTNGSTNILTTISGIDITFNQAVGIATTGTILLKSGSSGGTTIRTLGVSDIQPIPNGIRIKSLSILPYSTSIFPVIPNGFIKSTSGDYVGLNTTGASSYSFTTKSVSLGDPYEGGYLICQSGGIRWVVSPYSTTTFGIWANRSSAITCAQSVTGCTGWFVPSISQLQNPGYLCRIHWDTYAGAHWSNTDAGGNEAYCLNMSNGNAATVPKENNYASRTFRCVTY